MAGAAAIVGVAMEAPVPAVVVKFSEEIHGVDDGIWAGVLLVAGDALEDTFASSEDIGGVYSI